MAMSSYEKPLDGDKIEQFIESGQQAVVIDKESQLLLVRADFGSTSGQPSIFLCRCHREEDRVGVGAFSEVYPAQAVQYNKKDGSIRISQSDEFVIKIFKSDPEETKKKTTDHSDFSLTARQREAGNFRTVYGACSDVVSIKSDKAQEISFVVQKRLPGIPLFEVDSLSPQERNQLALQLTQELSDIHAKGIVHLDLKLGNILLSPSAEEFSVKLCDFGRSIQLPKNHKSRLMMAHDIPKADLDPARYPKECLSGQAGFATDIFMLGKLLQQEVVLKNGDIFPQLAGDAEGGKKVQQLYEHFLQQMAHEEASKRPSLDEIQNFFLKMDFLFRLEAASPHDYATKNALYEKMCESVSFTPTKRQETFSTYDLISAKLGGSSSYKPEEVKIAKSLDESTRKSPSFPGPETSGIMVTDLPVQILKDLISRQGCQDFNEKCEELGELSIREYQTLDNYLQEKIETAQLSGKQKESLIYETMQEFLNLHCTPKNSTPIPR